MILTLVSNTANNLLNQSSSAPHWVLLVSSSELLPQSPLGGAYDHSGMVIGDRSCLRLHSHGLLVVTDTNEAGPTPMLPGCPLHNGALLKGLHRTDPVGWLYIQIADNILNGVLYWQYKSASSLHHYHVSVSQLVMI